MTIISSEIVANRPIGNDGSRKIREKHVDHTGAVHYRTYLAGAGQDIEAAKAAHAQKINVTLVVRETNEFIDAIDQGNNPFVNAQGIEVAPVFSTWGEMVARVLTHFLTIPDPAKLVKAVPLISILTDAEIMSLLSISQQDVDRIRQSAIDVANIGTSMGSYVAPLEIAQ